MKLIMTNEFGDRLICPPSRRLSARHLVVILLVLGRNDRRWSGKVLLEEEVSLEKPGGSHF